MRPIPTALCLALIHEFEGQGGNFEATATQDPAGNWEIGWSHKLAGPTDETWTLEQADAQALADLRHAADAVCNILGANVYGRLTDGQYAALIDFTYNVGPGDYSRSPAEGGFAGSTLCKCVVAGYFNLVPGEFEKWIFSDGKMLNGLVRRRKAEIATWLTRS